MSKQDFYKYRSAPGFRLAVSSAPAASASVPATDLLRRNSGERPSSSDTKTPPQVGPRRSVGVGLQKGRDEPFRCCSLRTVSWQISRFSAVSRTMYFLYMGVLSVAQALDRKYGITCQFFRVMPSPDISPERIAWGLRFAVYVIESAHYTICEEEPHRL